MNIIDIILLLCFLPAVISGLRKGFIAQVIEIISLILGVWLSFRFASAVSLWLGQWIDTSAQLLNLLSFAVIFAVVGIALFCLGKILEKSIKIIMLGWLNKLLGVLFALIKCALAVGLVLIVFGFINSHTGIVKESVLSSSALYTGLKNFTDSVFPYLKDILFK